MSINILKVAAIFLVGMAGGIFADQIFWPYFVERPLFYEYRLEKNPVYLTEVKEITVEENTALRTSIEKVEKTVVGVRAQVKEGQVLEGSGLVVTSDGLMVTLAELVPQGSGFGFYVEGKKVSYQVLKRDLAGNLALVKLGETNLPTVSFANLKLLEPGERVFLIGTLFEAVEVKPQQIVALQQIVNEGIVKSFSEDFIKTNIFENHLLAGSPLFNIKGEVLGLNTIDFEGKVITIPITTIKEFIGL